MFEKGQLVVLLEDVDDFEIFGAGSSYNYLYKRGSLAVVRHVDDDGSPNITFNRFEPSWGFDLDNARRLFRPIRKKDFARG